MEDTQPEDIDAEHPDNPGDLDARFARAIMSKERELVAEHLSAEESANLATEYGHAKLKEVAALGLDVLRRDLGDRIRDLEEACTGYQTTLLDHWTDALDSYRLATECCRLVGIRMWHHADKERLGQQRLDLQSALTGTWARSVRTGAEVDVLLRTGFPRGAAARARTMHELAVTAFTLSEFGVQEKNADLGSRYVAYGAVKVWRDADEYQQHVHRLGAEPIDAEDLERYRREYEAAIATYSGLHRPNGWAASLPGYGNGSFKELELMAGLDHYRPYYSWFSHEVHSNIKGDRLSMVTSPHGLAYHLGPRMDGLADPAHAALRALHQVVAAWASILELKALDVVLLEAAHLLIDEAADALATAEKAPA